MPFLVYFDSLLKIQSKQQQNSKFADSGFEKICDELVTDEIFHGTFPNEYGQGIELERVWMKENGSNLILNGNIHMSEPYYIYEAIEFDTPKKWIFDFSCIVMGYEQTYFTLKN